MKSLFILFSILLSSCSSNIKMPQELPAPINDEIFIYSMITDLDFALKRYEGIKKNHLEEINEGYLLGKGKISSSSNIIQLVNSSFGKTNGLMMCFNPRHKIQYQSKLGSVEVDICFECQKTRVTINDWSRFFYHTKSIKDELNKLFSDAGLKIPVDE